MPLPDNIARYRLPIQMAGGVAPPPVTPMTVQTDNTLKGQGSSSDILGISDAFRAMTLEQNFGGQVREAGLSLSTNITTAGQIQFRMTDGSDQLNGFTYPQVGQIELHQIFGDGFSGSTPTNQVDRGAYLSFLRVGDAITLQEDATPARFAVYRISRVLTPRVSGTSTFYIYNVVYQSGPTETTRNKVFRINFYNANPGTEFLLPTTTRFRDAMAAALANLVTVRTGVGASGDGVGTPITLDDPLTADLKQLFSDSDAQWYTWFETASSESDIPGQGRCVIGLNSDGSYINVLNMEDRWGSVGRILIDREQPGTVTVNLPGDYADRTSVLDTLRVGDLIYLRGAIRTPAPDTSGHSAVFRLTEKHADVTRRGRPMYQFSVDRYNALPDLTTHIGENWFEFHVIKFQKAIDYIATLGLLDDKVAVRTDATITGDSKTTALSVANPLTADLKDLYTDGAATFVSYFDTPEDASDPPANGAYIGALTASGGFINPLGPGAGTWAQVGRIAIDRSMAASISANVPSGYADRGDILDTLEIGDLVRLAGAETTNGSHSVIFRVTGKNATVTWRGRPYQVFSVTRHAAAPNETTMVGEAWFYATFIKEAEFFKYQQYNSALVNELTDAVAGALPSRDTAFGDMLLQGQQTWHSTAEHPTSDATRLSATDTDKLAFYSISGNAWNYIPGSEVNWEDVDGIEFTARQSTDYNADTNTFSNLSDHSGYFNVLNQNDILHFVSQEGTAREAIFRIDRPHNPRVAGGATFYRYQVIRLNATPNIGSQQVDGTVYRITFYKTASGDRLSLPYSNDFLIRLANQLLVSTTTPAFTGLSDRVGLFRKSPAYMVSGGAYVKSGAVNETTRASGYGQGHGTRYYPANLGAVQGGGFVIESLGANNAEGIAIKIPETGNYRIMATPATTNLWICRATAKPIVTGASQNWLRSATNVIAKSQSQSGMAVYIGALTVNDWIWFVGDNIWDNTSPTVTNRVSYALQMERFV